MRKNNFRTGHIGSVGINHLHNEERSLPEQPAQPEQPQPSSIFKIPQVERKKRLKFQRQ
jgi:hypothetical protein